MVAAARSKTEVSDQALSLYTFYSGWEAFQRNLVAMIAPLSREQLALPASSHHWTIGMVAQHIVANRVWWFQMWMGEGSSELAAIAHWDPADPVEQPPLGSAELVAGLEATWQMIQETLARWTPADLGQTFSPPAAMSEEERSQYKDLSRQWMIWHVLEHEILHTGELSLALGSSGLRGLYGDM
jgi:uncharacterized damage-inducible protein DinB